MDQVYIPMTYAVLHAVELVASTRANRGLENNAVGMGHKGQDPENLQ